MARRLICLRHAKSSWASGALSDFDRPLASRGENAAPRIGRWLSKEGYAPDHVVSSPALRARQTAELICHVLRYSTSRIVWDRTVYDATVPGLLGALTRIPASSAVAMLVGHNPALENLVRYLARPGDVDESADKIMPAGAAYVLELPDQWVDLTGGAARVLAHASPRLLESQGFV